MTGPPGPFGGSLTTTVRRVPTPPPSPVAGPGDLAGRRLAGRYRLTRPIAAGGMARVWEAEDEVLTRPVAVKVLHPHLAADASFVARFRAEAIAAARLAHPAIVSVYDTWSGDGLEAIVMELVRGTTLRRELDERGRLPPSEAVAVAAAIATALDTAHRAGTVHRDIKPANVLLSEDGRVLVTDFGIAKATESADLTTERQMLGTAKYLAPEQVEGTPVDGRTDLYALGVVLYEMVCGQPPFLAESEAATALARLSRAPEPPSSHEPGLPPPLEAVIMRCLARRPAERFASAADLKAALAGVDTALAAAALEPAGPGPPTATEVVETGPSTDLPPTEAGFEPYPGPPPPAARARSRRRRNAGPWVVAGLVLAALAVTGLLIGRAASDDGDDGGRPDRERRAAIAVAGAAAFDPFGTAGEHDDEAFLAVDGDLTTAWRTETYRGADLNKPGVGLVVRLETASPIERLVVNSPNAGWTAEVYVVDGEVPADLAGWGQPVASARDIAAGETVLTLDGRQGSAVLVWITALGGDARVLLSEVRAFPPEG